MTKKKSNKCNYGCDNITSFFLKRGNQAAEVVVGWASFHSRNEILNRVSKDLELLKSMTLYDLISSNSMTFSLKFSCFGSNYKHTYSKYV